MSGHDGVDWAGAARWAGRLASPGPVAPRAELVTLVEDLRAAAARAVPLAARAGRFGALPADHRRAQLLVVDRPGWAHAASASFAALAEGLDDDPQGAVAGRAGTAQLAGLLGVLAGRVLGQFDPFAGPVPGGRLLLVAPNLLHAERRMGVDRHDLHLWVCVHEQTHALQFAAAPWLADHLRAAMAGVVGAAMGAAGQDPGPGLVSTARALRSRGSGDLGLLGALLTPDQRREVDAITAVMSVLEGHADVTMDAVPARLVASKKVLRARLDARRRATGFDAVLRRVLGLEAKAAQYRQGAAFVRGVRRLGGRGALEAVWSGPAALPLPGEITDPAAWVARVHG